MYFEIHVEIQILNLSEALEAQPRGRGWFPPEQLFFPLTP